ncbi:MAG TPA: hypothetical protein VJN94_03895 [Candidatus Binataceae bacterium]|nr:hypothetical protein [Candidatus Binataceae bacterium]
MYRPTRSPAWFACTAAGFALAAVWLSGCAPDFSQRVANHRGCTGDAQIEPWKVNQCMSYGAVHRDAFDNCLAERGVPPRKIRMLNECVEARSEY